MVLSINEEITVLEEQMANIKGPGSIEKKKNLQKKIDELKESERPNGDESRDKVQMTDSSQPGIPDAVKAANSRPLPTNWVKVTDHEREKAEREGRLCGYDPFNKTALIRD
jgi:hypothetical protein